MYHNEGVAISPLTDSKMSDLPRMISISNNKYWLIQRSEGSVIIIHQYFFGRLKWHILL